MNFRWGESSGAKAWCSGEKFAAAGQFKFSNITDSINWVYDRLTGELPFIEIMYQIWFAGIILSPEESFTTIPDRENYPAYACRVKYLYNAAHRRTNFLLLNEENLPCNYRIKPVDCEWPGEAVSD